MNKKLSTDELNRPNLERYRNQSKFPIIVALDNVRSLSNVGSVFRTADAFNVEQLILGGITGTPPHREIQRTALGATESVEWIHQEELLPALLAFKKQGYQIISLEQCERSTSPKELNLNPESKVVLVVGNEVEGVAQSIIDHSDLCLEIPQLGTKHSLNVTVATGIALWELFSVYIASR